MDGRGDCQCRRFCGPCEEDPKRGYKQCTRGNSVMTENGWVMRTHKSVGLCACGCKKEAFHSTCKKNDDGTFTLRIHAFVGNCACRKCKEGEGEGEMCTKANSTSNDEGKPVLHAHFEVGACACGDCGGEMCTKSNSRLNDDGEWVLDAHFEVGACACGECAGEMCTKSNSRLNDDGEWVLRSHFEVGACACGECGGEMCTKANSRLNDEDKPVLKSHLFRVCCICDKRGNYNQVYRLHPDGIGHCHNTYSCYGLHKFAHPLGCGLCGGLVYEIQKTPEQVLEIVRSQGNEAGYKRGIANGSIVKLDRPVCADCMDDEILEKAETLQENIHAENFRALPKGEQDARMTVLINGLSHLKLFCKSPLSTLQFSFEDESDCSEDERY